VDIDILVYEQDALRAFGLLISHGYMPEVKIDNGQIRAYVKTEYSIALFGKGGGAIIELHWDMTGRYLGSPFRLAHFSDRLEQTRLAGKDVYQMPPEELLLYLCAHGSKDCWDKLESISSVAGLIRSCKKMDWVRMEELARSMKCERMLLLGLFPEKIEELGDQAPSDFSYYHLKVRDTALDKMFFVMRLVFRPSRQDWRRFPLSGRFSFLHYLLRPLRLISETMAK
jgi:hypothetical protein